MTPPQWPRPPEGWSPPVGWRPDPAWGPAPEAWQFWVAEEETAPSLPGPASPPATLPEPTPEDDRAAHATEIIGTDGRISLIGDHVFLEFTGRRMGSQLKKTVGLRAYPLAAIADLRVDAAGFRGQPTLQVLVRPGADLLRPLLKHPHLGPDDDLDTLILRKGGTIPEADAFVAAVRRRLAPGDADGPVTSFVDSGRLPLTVKGSDTRATFDGTTVTLEVGSWTASPIKKNSYPRRIPATAISDVVVVHPKMTGQLRFLQAGGPGREVATDPKTDLDTVALNADNSQSYAIFAAAVLTAGRLQRR